MDRIPLRSAIRDRLCLRRRKTHDDGATAIEFALVATPFFMMIFGLVEVCLIIFMSAMLEYGANEASRGIRTGIFQASGSTTQTDLKQNICNSANVLPSCMSRLELDVQRLTSFGSAGGASSPYDANGQFDSTAVSFDVGNGNDIMVVRAYYTWPLFTPLLTRPLANLGPDRRLLTAALVFKNEPF